MAERIFEQFINTYSKAVKGTSGFERTILTSVDLNSLELTKGYYVSQWRNNTQDKDMLRRFSISFVSEPYWNMFEIPCQYYSLKEDQTFSVSVYNLSDEKQLQEYSGQISQIRKRDFSGINTPQQLLERLDVLFPSLIFHQVALNQLEGQVQVCHVGTLCNKLMSLERYFSKWDGERFEEEAFPSKSVSTQSKQTLERFRKGHIIPGRIYFHPANKLKKAYICSLTTKLPTVSEPKKRI